MNIKTLYQKSVSELDKAGIPTPEIDAKVLLLSVMEKSSSFVYSHPEFLITNAQYSKFRRYIRRRKTGEPVAYIIGHKEFYGFDFLVNKNVLVPRPESEWLVEKGVEYVNKLSVIGCQLSVLDVGTGSGCIAIAIAKSLQNTNYSLPNIKLFAVDNSSRAVSVAKKNAKENCVESIAFLNSNLFSNRRIKNKIFDLIVANLPYVPQDKLKVKNNKFKVTNPISFEPQDAIFADDGGTAIIKEFLKQAKKHTKSGGAILLELDPRNANNILKFSKTLYPTSDIALYKDLASLDRYINISIK